MRKEPIAVKTVPRQPYDTPAFRVKRYWHRHPGRAFSLMLALMRAQDKHPKYEWPEIVSQSTYKWIDGRADPMLLVKRPDKVLFRIPPKPYSSSGGCPMCGGIRYNLGWHTDWDGNGPSKRGYWHAACGSAYNLMSNPSDFYEFFRGRQNGKCSASGDMFQDVDIDIDHIIPLYRVYRDFRSLPIDQLIAFWGPDNLRGISKEAHKSKSAYEARERAGHFN